MALFDGGIKRLLSEPELYTITGALLIVLAAVDRLIFEGFAIDIMQNLWRDIMGGAGIILLLVGILWRVTKIRKKNNKEPERPVLPFSTSDDYKAEFISQNYKELKVRPNEIFLFEVKWRNIGRKPWPRLVRMGTQLPRDHPCPYALIGQGGWVSVNRVEFDTPSVEPGETATYKIPMKAPAQEGVYRECFGLVFDGYRWFEECPIICIKFVVDA